LSPVPNIDEVAGQSAGDQEQGIDANRVAISGVAGREPLGGDRDPAQAIFIECPCCGVFGAALFDLDEGQCPAATRNEVDLATGNAGAPRENSPALQPQPPGGERFGPTPPRFG
jgi:hypothetical protein